MATSNLNTYRCGYSRYGSSVEILAAIDERATDSLPMDDVDDEAAARANDAVLMWEDPTEAEQAAVIARAWELADADTDALYWGCMTVRREGV